MTLVELFRLLRRQALFHPVEKYVHLKTVFLYEESADTKLAKRTDSLGLLLITTTNTFRLAYDPIQKIRSPCLSAARNPYGYGTPTN